MSQTEQSGIRNSRCVAVHPASRIVTRVWITPEEGIDVANCAVGSDRSAILRSKCSGSRRSCRLRLRPLSFGHKLALLIRAQIGTTTRALTDKPFPVRPRGKAEVTAPRITGRAMDLKPAAVAVIIARATAADIRATTTDMMTHPRRLRPAITAAAMAADMVARPGLAITARKPTGRRIAITSTAT